MRRPAFLIVLELAVALEDHPAVFVLRVPYLGAVPVPALGTLDLRGKYARAAVPCVHTFPPLHFLLHQLPCFGRDDCLVVPLHIILRDFPLVLLPLLREEVRRVLLLQERIPFVLLVSEDAFDSQKALISHRKCLSEEPCSFPPCLFP